MTSYGIIYSILLKLERSSLKVFGVHFETIEICVSNLQGFNNIFNEEDRLESQEEIIEFCEESISKTRDLIGGQSDIDIQKLLK